MVFVHSFWSKPLLNNKFSTVQSLYSVVINDYATSVSFIHKNGHKIKLYADRRGAEILSFIPYDEVILIDTLDNASIHFAAQIKFEALRHMSLDEILIDGDLFMRFPDAYVRLQELSKNNDFIYSMFEPNWFILSSDQQIDKYRTIRELLCPYLSEFKYPYTLDGSIYDYQWPNTSLMLFTSQRLKDEYVRQYHHYKGLLERVDFKNTWPDTVIEQRHMYKLLSTGYTAAPMIEDFPSKESNDYALKIGFTHLGYAKSFYDDVVKGWLKEMDPQLHEYVNNFDINDIII